MTNVNKTKTILGAVLISICIFSLFLAASSYQQMKKSEEKFNKEKAGLIKEGMDLQDKIDSLSKELKEKTLSLNTLETEKKIFTAAIKTLESQSKNIEKQYIKRVDSLKKENSLLNKKIDDVEKIPITQLLKKALSEEGNESIKKLLEDALYKIEMIKAGKAVDLEPIVVTGEAAAQVKEPQKEGEIFEKKTGKILSVDAKNNLIVIGLGYSNNIKENQRCLIVKDGKEVAFADTINVRYRISAAFVNDIKYGHTINDIKEGDEVSIVEE